MHRIDTPTAQKDKFGQGKSGFTNGDPTTGTPSTGLDEAIFDAWQEEVCTVIERTGIKLNKDQHDQLYQAIRTLSKEDLSKALLKAQNLADLPDKGAARSSLEVYSQSQTDGKYLPKTGGTVTGALHVTHSVNVGDVDSGLIASGDGNVAFYANNVKTGEWNNDRLHWIKNMEIGGALNVSGDANFIKNINTKANINAWDLKANGGVYDQGQRVYSSRNPPTSANLSQNGWYKDNYTGFIYQWGYVGGTNVY